MTGDSRTEARAPSLNRLLVVISVLVVVVIGLGAAIVALQLNSTTSPRSETEKDLNLWRRLADDNPEEAWAYVGLGGALLANGDQLEAEEALREALVLEPESTEALFQLGLIARDTNPDVALDYLRRSADSASGGDRARPLLAIGDLLSDLGRWDEAREAFEDSIQELPFLLPAHLGLARALEALGDTQGALEAYVEAQRFNPEDPEILEAISRLAGSAGTTDR